MTVRAVVSTMNPPPPASGPPAAAEPPSGERFHQLDGLRGIACLLVVATHAGGATAARAIEARGWPQVGRLVDAVFSSGVELFFVLSGAVLLRAALRGARPFDPTAYARRRVARVYPPYLTCLALAVPLLLVAERFPTWYSREMLPPFRGGDFLRQVPLLWPTDLLYNLAWWTLQIEAWFYVVAPLVVLAWGRRPFRAGTALAAGAVCVAVSVAAGLAGPAGLAGTPPFVCAALRFTSCFFMGVVLAKTDLPPWVARLLVVVGVAWVLGVAGLASVLGVATLPGLGFHVGFGLLYGGIVSLALDPDGRLARPLTRPLLVWLGERSYSLFLIHVTVFHAVNYLVSRFVPGRTLAYALWTRGLGLPLALLAAMVLFEVVERRFARGLVTADSFWPPVGGGGGLAGRRASMID